MNSNDIEELIAGMSDKDIESLIAESKEKKKIKRTKRVVEKEQVYRGTVIYTCQLCCTQKKGGCTSNKPDMVYNSKVKTCDRCEEQLTLLDKEHLIKLLIAEANSYDNRRT